MSSTNSATSATVGPTPCCSASAWSAPPPSKTSGRSGSLKSGAAALSRRSSLWERSATCGRTSKCWSSWRGGGRGRCWRKTPERWRKKSVRWRTSSALRWRKRIWKRCSTWPSPWGCDTLTGEHGGRGKSAARPIRWRCCPSPGGRSTCASSRERERGHDRSETGTADLFGGTELDIKTSFFYIHMDDAREAGLNDFNSEAACACLSCVVVVVWLYPEKALCWCLKDRQHGAATTVCSTEPGLFNMTVTSIQPKKKKHGVNKTSRYTDCVSDRPKKMWSDSEGWC